MRLGMRQKCHAARQSAGVPRSNPSDSTIRVAFQPRCSLRATAILGRRRYAAISLTASVPMISSVVSEGRLLGLTPFDWSMLLGSSTLCGVLTLLF